MRSGIALARAGAPGPSDVAERNVLGSRLLEAMSGRPPRAHVLRLLLRPDDLLERRIGADELRGLLDRERVELLQAGDGNVPGLRAPLVPDDVVVDLPAAEHEPADVLRID